MRARKQVSTSLPVIFYILIAPHLAWIAVINLCAYKCNYIFIVLCFKLKLKNIQLYNPNFVPEEENYIVSPLHLMLSFYAYSSSSFE